MSQAEEEVFGEESSACSADFFGGISGGQYKKAIIQFDFFEILV